MIFSELVNEAALEAQIKTSDTTGITKIKQAMKRHYEKLWHSFLWNDTMFLDRAITLASGGQEIIIDNDIETVLYLTEQSLQRVLKPAYVNVFSIDNVLDIGSSITPWKYTNAGSIGLPARTTVATKIWVQSSSALDTINIRVHGKDSNGNRVSESIALTGTSLIEGTISFAAGEIDSITKSDLTTGTITIKDDDAATLDTIAPRSYGNEYKILKLTSTADQAYTLYLTGKYRLKQLEYDEDMPKFNCGQALSLYGQAKIFQDRGELTVSKERKQEAAIFIKSLLDEKFINATNQEDTMPTLVRSEMDMPIMPGGV